jgi:hypothetical protein
VISSKGNEEQQAVVGLLIALDLLLASNSFFDSDNKFLLNVGVGDVENSFRYFHLARSHLKISNTSKYSSG